MCFLTAFETLGYMLHRRGSLSEAEPGEKREALELVVVAERRRPRDHGLKYSNKKILKNVIQPRRFSFSPPCAK